MKHQRHGSALALVRAVFEAMIRAHWVVKSASNEQVDQVAENDDFWFPGMGDLAKAVDEAYSDPNDGPLDFFHQFVADAWKVMNSYAHPGLRQLVRQFAGGAGAEPLTIRADYREEDLVAGVSIATTSILLLGYVFARATQREAEAKEIQRLFE